MIRYAQFASEIILNRGPLTSGAHRTRIDNLLNFWKECLALIGPGGMHESNL